MGCLIWADDILLMSKSEEGLKNMLLALGKYSEENGMTINTKKTQTIISNKAEWHIRSSLLVGHDRLESTREYKYLGFVVTPSGEINTGLKDLKNRALKAFSKLKKKMGV